MIKIYNPTKRPIEASLVKTVKLYGDQLDLVISYGGDGTLLGSERLYPGVSKLPIRSSQICNMCYSADSLEPILKSIINKDILPKNHIKLIASFNGKKLIALNEISIKAKKPNLALRFSYKINQINYPNNIADGLIIATPFGSTGYFKSISRTVFQQGIGVAVNNPVSPTLTNIIDDLSIIEITIDREDGIICADNNPKIYNLKIGDKITIQKAQKPALIY